MSTVTTKDGVEIYYKDWGKGQPIVFSHGWPLSADDWDAQMLFFLDKGYRVIAHDRRGHGRSTQVGDGHDMDHYADDLVAVTAHLDLEERDSRRPFDRRRRGGALPRTARRGPRGEGRHHQRGAAVDGENRRPIRAGLPKEVFDDFQAQLAANRSEFYLASRRSVLQFQPPGREALRGHRSETGGARA